jgi:MFS family permease
MNIFAKIQKMEKLSKSLRSLYFHKVIRDVSTGLVGMFGPIFIYVLSGSLEFALIFYGAMNVLYIIIVPAWARLLQYKSMHIFMIIGTVSLIIYDLGYYFLDGVGRISWPLIIILIIALTITKLFYWAPYHIDFTRFVNKHHRGRQLSYLAILVSLVGIVLPIVGAFIITKFGFQALFVIGIIILVISIFPLLFVPRVREKYSFKYFETFKQFFDGEHIKTNLAYMADGFQGNIGGLIWPIFIFMILKGEYMQVGLISAAVVLVSCVLRFFVGEATDKFDKQKLMKTGSILFSIGWLFKAIVYSGLHIFVVGIFHDFSAILMRTPFNALVYEIAADEGHYVDEFTIMREIALNFGRILMKIVALALLFTGVSIVWIFVIGAGVSLLINLVSKEEFYLATHR